jgi:uncharacterized membrane protein
MSATLGGIRRTGRRYRVVAVGSGLSGLIAIKGLKFAQLNITDALVFLTGVIAHRASHLLNHISLGVAVIPATAALATVGLVIALSVAVIGEFSKHRVAQAACHSGLWRLAKGWL